MSTIAIIGAMDEEVANIASALSDITVTEEAGVSVTRDGSYATCYLSLLADTQDAEAKKQAEDEVLAGLASAKGVIKKEISKQVKVRHIPELIFKMDHSMDYGRHIDEILDSMDFDSYQKDEEQSDEE